MIRKIPCPQRHEYDGRRDVVHHLIRKQFTQSVDTFMYVSEASPSASHISEYVLFGLDTVE